MISKEASVRVDFLGGTLDLEPIHLIIPDVVTINAALSLKAQVQLESIQEPYLEVYSHDYQKEWKLDPKQLESDQPMALVVCLWKFFGMPTGLRLELKSGSPAGAGLGGSSAMGVALFLALAEHDGASFSRSEVIQIVRSSEAQLLYGPAGYQDHHPGLYGGILALHPGVESVHVEQLYSVELKAFLESHLSLVYSGQGRLSGINNWEVYKAFLSREQKTDQGLRAIAEISSQGYQALQAQDYSKLLVCIAKEGRLRAELFPNIVTAETQTIYLEAQKLFPELGMKACGAGGGGCYLLLHKPEEKKALQEFLHQQGQQVLPFDIAPELV